MYTTTRYVFEQVKRSQTLRGKCSVCGRKTQQTVVSNQTLNPFNKNAEGRPKCYAEVLESVEADLVKNVERLNKRGIKCSNCR